MRSKEEIEQLVEYAKSQGMQAIEVDGIKFTLGSNIGFPRNPYVEEMKAEEIVKPLDPLEDLTDEEIMYWATPWYDELQARKEAKINQKQIDDELKKSA